MGSTQKYAVALLIMLNFIIVLLQFTRWAIDDDTAMGVLSVGAATTGEVIVSDCRKT